MCVVQGPVLVRGAPSPTTITITTTHKHITRARDTHAHMSRVQSARATAPCWLLSTCSAGPGSRWVGWAFDVMYNVYAAPVPVGERPAPG